MAKILLGIALISIITYRVFKRPEELAIFLLILHSTFRVIVEGNMVAWGGKGSNIRFEYILFFMALFIFSRHFFMPSFRTTTPVMRALFAMMGVHLASIPIAYAWGVHIGFGVAVRLVETFAYIIILVYFTRRQHLPKLLNAMLAIGCTISLVLLILSITKNPQLYQLINGRDIEGRLVTIGGEALGADFGWLAYSIHSLPILGCMAFIMFLLKKRHNVWYGLTTLIILVQSLASGQRSPNLVLIAGLVIIVFTIPVLFKSRVGYTKIALIAGALIVITFLVFAESHAMSSRFMLLLTRFQATNSGLSSDGQQVGHQLAMEQLGKDGLMAWLFGYSGFISTRTTGRFSYDINTPIVLVMKFGMMGSMVLLYTIFLILVKALRMLGSIAATAEEISIIYGIILFILFWLPGSFLRGSVFSENIRMLSWFGIWVAWMEVMYRDRFHSANSIPGSGRKTAPAF